MSITLALLSAHLLSDFPLQRDEIAANKLSDWRYRTLHIIPHATLTFAFLLLMVSVELALQASLLIGVAHWLIDTRRWAEPKDGFELYPIAVDQSLHITSLFLVSVVFL